MERGIEQLFLVALIVLAALIDLFVRWVKRKTAQDRRAPVDEEQVFIEEDDSERLEPTRVEPEHPPVMQPSPRSPRSSRSLRAPVAPIAPAAGRQPSPRTVTPRRRARRWLTHPIDARRGIVLMAILGPCRGLAAPQEDA